MSVPYILHEIDASQSDKLPEFYLMYTGNLEDVLEQMVLSKPTLEASRMTLLKPYSIYKVKHMANTSEEYYTYAVELKRQEE